MNDFREDGQEISESLPAFTIEDNRIIPEEPVGTYIHQTNSIIFTFDPNGELTSTDVDQNLAGTAIGVALLENQFYISIPNYPIQVPYAQMEGLTDQVFRDLLFGMEAVGGPLLLLTFLPVAFFMILLTLFYNFLYTLFANIVAAFTRRPLRFFDNWRLVLVASTLPTVFFAVFNSLGLVPYFQLELRVLLTLYIYYLAIRRLPAGQLPR